MPNWCEGTLKIRGAKENMLNFIKNGLEPSNGDNIQIEKEHDTYDGHEIESVYVHINGEPYVNGTRRAFINSCDAYAFEDNDVMIFDVMQAWGFNIDEWLEIAKEYHIDIRLYGFEQGMEFNQEIEILNGKPTINRIIHFNDYRWECIEPNFGG